MLVRFSRCDFLSNSEFLCKSLFQHLFLIWHADCYSVLQELHTHGVNHGVRGLKEGGGIFTPVTTMPETLIYQNGFTFSDN